VIFHPKKHIKKAIKFTKIAPFLPGMVQPEIQLKYKYAAITIL